MLEEVLQHGGAIRSSTILYETFRRISQLWDNTHTLNVEICLLYSSSTITTIQPFCYDFVNNVQNTFSFGSALDERTRNKLYGVISVEFIYLTARVARQWIKERGITHFTQLRETKNSPMMVIKFAYVGELTHRRVARTRFQLTQQSKSSENSSTADS